MIGSHVAGQTPQLPGAVPGDAALRPHLVVQFGEFVSVYNADISADGRLAITTGQAARLYETATGRQLREFVGSRGEIVDAAFTPDGRYVLSSGQDTTPRLWNVATGAQVRTFNGHTRSVPSLAVSDDGQWLLTGSDDRTAKLWEIATGRLARTFKGHDDVLTGVAISPDGRRVLTASWDKTIKLWDAGSGRTLRTFRKERPPNDVAFFPTGSRIVTAHLGGTAIIWDAESGASLHALAGHGLRSVDSVAVSPDGRYVLTASDDGTAKLWDAESGKDIRTFSGHTAGVESVRFSHDGRSALTSSHDGTARLWNIETGQEIRTLAGHSDAISTAAFSRDGRHILTGRFHNSAMLWDGETGREVRRFVGPRKVGVFEFALAPDATFMVSASTGKTPELWDTTTGQQIRTFVGHTDDVRAVAISPDGRRVLTGSQDNTARLWDASTGETLQTFAGHKWYVIAVAFSPDGRRVLTGCLDGTALLWDVQSGRTLQTLTGHTDLVAGVAFSPDGSTLLTGGADGTARLWDAATGKPLRRMGIPDGHFGVVSFSPDGRRVLTGSPDRTARLWDAETGQLLRTFAGHTSTVTSVAFSPGGRLIMTGSTDHTTRLWNPETGAELCTLVSFDDDSWAVVDPGGRFDTNSLDRNTGLQWVMPDDPLRALPLEIFMRDYYEPGLLRKVLAGERLTPVRSLLDVNRAQPAVSIARVQPHAEDPGLIDVTVEVGTADLVLERDGQPVKTMTTGVYDVRLFRDGQIVGEWPPISSDQRRARPTAGQETLEQWRQANVVAIDGAKKTTTIAFNSIRLPQRTGLQATELTAYAFNEDRVKSETVRISYELPKTLAPRKGRAYLIAVGVNLSEDPVFDLRFAAKDARAVSDGLYERLAALGDYEAVIRVPLVSDYETKGGTRVPLQTTATKAAIKAVLDLLAGRTPDRAALQGVASAEAIKPARPEDLLILSFSSHGYADGSGRFYFLPSDIGKDASAVTTDVLLPRAVSSDELSDWLHAVDAGQIAMIADACQSAATVESAGFKPGPMGSRGLGQLAYDKRIRILTASQAADVAWEYDALQHGLLTYALVRDGLDGREADYLPKDGEVKLTEWLAFAAERVPKLDSAIREGRLPVSQGGARRVPDGPAPAPLQHPVLFDFGRAAKDVRILR